MQFSLNRFHSLMQQAAQPIVKDLVFIGGGHSHAIVLQMWGMQPIPGVRLTLITNVLHTPYSGMLPGYVAGVYDFDACHIDLQPLSRFAQAQLVVDQAIALDLDHNRVICAEHPPITFDWLSIDIGSTPTVAAVPGAKEHAIPVKPISQFLDYWHQLLDEIEQTPAKLWNLGIVGGGAGGVELAFSMQGHLKRRSRTQPGVAPAQLHLFHRGQTVMPERGLSLGRQCQQLLHQQGVALHLNENVTAIVAAESSPAKPYEVQCESGLVQTCDRVFWVTQAAAAPWIRQSGLATDERGFLQVNDCLQSVSHPQVFAAGDIAAMVNHPRPKAGVFAVRQGKPLLDNLRRIVLGLQPLPFQPQQDFLTLIGLGDGRAIASRGKWHVGPAKAIWQWKDRIDRKFMQRFSELQPMLTSDSSMLVQSAQPTPTMYCAGCAAKVGSDTLSNVLQRLQAEHPEWPVAPDVLVGLESPDDAAVLQFPSDQALVQTVDYFPALVSDPFLFGQITANHALNDLYAMGAAPHSVMAIATLPHGVTTKVEETLYQLLSGVLQVIHPIGATLVGGHTVEGAELALGLTCNGLATAEKLLRKKGMQPGDALILTKPLGTGSLFAADMRMTAKGRWLQGAIASMLQSNQPGMQCLQRHHVHACTDVSGFGLAGHLLEMVRASQVSVTLELAKLPILPGALEMVQQGILSSLQPQNIQVMSQLELDQRLAAQPQIQLLFDPQTAGGLLAAAPGDLAEHCVESLQQLGYDHSCVIGQVHAGEAGRIWIR